MGSAVAPGTSLASSPGEPARGRSPVFDRTDALGIEHEPVRPQRHFHTFGQGRCLDALPRDPGAILAVKVRADVVVVLPSEFRMEPRDTLGRILEHQVVLWRAADPQRVIGDGACHSRVPFR